MADIGCGPLDVVEAPPPLSPVKGLLPTAEAAVAGVRLVVDGDDHWLNGVEFQPFPTDTGSVHNPFSAATGATEKGYGDEVDTSAFGPFTALVEDSCRARAVRNDQAYRARILAQFAAVESSIIARELLTGERTMLNPHLADGEGTFPNGDTAVSLSRAVALLEGEIAKSGRQGIIHMSPLSVATLSSSFNLIEITPSALRTINGTLIVADAGYIVGARPAGSHPQASATQEWVYASGPIDIRRVAVQINPPTLSEALDRGVGASNGNANTVTYRAERHYVIAWDTTIHAAVLANQT